ncbi:uncharacterized protein LOC133820027 [Humulus lupulus]|uniref:uncharacterized protein LOC133820027 n=1 Tax=Humulus lupulus TaxID=3486 RepID=UPI002B40D93D|nr:uncharacterized protein LOC133820027 [Humulus lupulus]
MARTRHNTSASLRNGPQEPVEDARQQSQMPEAPNSNTNGGHNSASNRFAPLDNLDHSPLEDANNPYFLGNGDHPGLILASPPLTDKNFQQWRQNFMISIGAKNKSNFLNGSLSQPSPNDPHFHSWQRCNQMIMSWIIHSVSPDIKSSIMFLNSTAAMWVELNNRFNQGNGPRLFELRQTLIRLHQGDDSISSYFTKLKAIWDEINEICPRTPCTCAAAADNLDSHNQEQVLQFLTCLNESYHAVRAQVLLIDPLPSLSKVFSMIILEERQRNLGPSTNPNIIATTTSNQIPVQYPPTD